MIRLVGLGFPIHSSTGLRALRSLLGLVLRRRYDEGDWVAKLHDIVYKDFDIIRARDLEFDLAEEGHVCCVQGPNFTSPFRITVV